VTACHGQLLLLVGNGGCLLMCKQPCLVSATGRVRHAMNWYLGYETMAERRHQLDVLEHHVV
jgi:hypothetical protein